MWSVVTKTWNIRDCLGLIMWVLGYLVLSTGLNIGLSNELRIGLGKELSAAPSMPAVCQSSHTKISQLSLASKKQELTLEQPVKIQGIVSGVFPDLPGFFLLEEREDWDDQPSTSEGIFIVDTTDAVHKVQVGDKLSVMGTLEKTAHQIQLTKLSQLSVCGSGIPIIHQKLTLPLSVSLDGLAAMPVHLTQKLTISDTYQLARFGQFTVSNGRLFQPTQLYPAGEQAQQQAALNAKNRLIIDDGSNQENPPLINQAQHIYRTGNMLHDVQGILQATPQGWVVLPTAQLQITANNSRQAEPLITQSGKLRIASFNVLNYFNGDGQGGGFPTKRGARSAQEFTRQAQKIIAALAVLDADIIGLMEVENDGFGQLSAIADLTARLNRATDGQYQYIRPQNKPLGDDSITVGILYKANRVEAKGPAVSLTTAPFGEKSRLPIAQSFALKGGKDEFTLVVNHFKSKGGCPTDQSDINARQADGQGCWNATRLASSQQLLAWLQQDPTGRNVQDSKDQDILIIGDLNAYAEEDPIIAIQEAGYRNLIKDFNGRYTYSYVYRGEAGYLDHALASASLARKVVDTKIWWINADEMRLTDYQLQYKTPAQQRDLYRPDAFRSSDHDPVIIELQLQ